MVKILNLDDVYFHSEVGTGFSKDAMLKICGDEIGRLRTKVAELQALLIEQYESDKDLYESPHDIEVNDYEVLINRHDKSFEALGNYIKAMKGEKEL